MTRTLVVDDSHFMRTVITDILEEAGINVVAQASNGREAVKQVIEHDPDVVTMDVEMPEMNGIEAVEKIMDRHPVPIMMLSALTTEGADSTLDALDNGAVDFFAKPSGTISTDLSVHGEALVETVQSVAASDPSAQQISSIESSRDTHDEEYVETPTLVIGASTGGPNVVESILEGLPRAPDFRILVVQHMPDQFTGRFAKRLDSNSAYSVREAEDGARIGGGEAVIAKGDYHMIVSNYRSGRLRVKLEQSEPVHSVRPAIDVTMKSVAETITDPVTGVVLTGMGSDGAAGVKAIDRIDSKILAQNESTSAVFGIPGRAIETGCVDEVLPVEDLVDGILRTVRVNT
jgi:two-component system chemotaxis response regulator CheB